MPAERDALEAFAARIEPRGSADAARRRGDQLRRRRRVLTSVGACAVVLAIIGGAAVAADRVTEVTAVIGPETAKGGAGR